MPERSNVRISVLAALLFASGAVYQFGPSVLNLGDGDRDLWANAWWIITPGLAALMCFLAAARSDEHDRSAWRNLGAGCAVWAAGAIAWALDGAKFPGPADAAYLITCVFFVRGMFLFCRIGAITRIQTSNFVLALSAVGTAVFLLLLPYLVRSELDAYATTVALLYPVAWLGTTAFGMMCLVSDAPARKRPILRLLVIGCLVQSVANTFYAMALMGSSYGIGAVFDSGWIVGFLLIAWGAGEQIRLSETDEARAVPRRSPAWRHVVDAFIPAAALGLVFAAAGIFGALHTGPVFLGVAPPAVLFVAFLALRGHWMLSRERKLLTAARRDREELSLVLESTIDYVVSFDAQWRTSYVNRHAQEFLRRTVVGGEAAVELSEAFPAIVRRRLERQYRLSRALRQPSRFEEYLSEPGIWLQIHAVPNRDGLSIFFRDITAERRSREELEHHGRHDPLTGLANRLESTGAWPRWPATVPRPAR